MLTSIVRKRRGGPWGSRTALVLLLALPAAAHVAGGCVIRPTIPRVLPGYGHTYTFVDEHEKPVGSGLVLLESQYAGEGYRYRCFPLDGGVARVPRQTEMYWSHEPFLLVSLFPQGMFSFFLLHVFTAKNADVTCVHLLVPGYAFAKRYGGEEYGYSMPVGPRPPSEVVHLRRVAPREETSHLNVQVRYWKDWHQNRTGPRNSRDKQALERALDYARDRLAALEAKPP